LKKLEYIGVKEESKPFRVQSASVMKQELDALPKGKYKLTIAKYFRKASHPQFKYLYGLVYPLSMIALNDTGYEFVNIDQVDAFWKSMFANKEVLNRETGEILKIPLSKSEFMTIDENAYCDAIRNYVSEYLSTNIPDPEINWKEKKLNNNILLSLEGDSQD
jgi:hypothetical protein